jgi:hypothetical protein
MTVKVLSMLLVMFTTSTHDMIPKPTGFLFCLHLAHRLFLQFGNYPLDLELTRELGALKGGGALLSYSITSAVIKISQSRL